MLAEFETYWTWEEAYQLVKEQVAMMNIVNHKAHTIICTSGRSMVVPSGAPGNIQRLARTTHPNEDAAIIGSEPPLMILLFKLRQQIFEIRDTFKRYRFVSTVEEACTPLDQSIKNRHQAV